MNARVIQRFSERLGTRPSARSTVQSTAQASKRAVLWSLPILTWATFVASIAPIAPAFGADFVAPVNDRPVVDEVGVYSAAERADLETALRSFKSAAGVQMSVLVPASLQDLTIEEYGIKLADAWKLGEKKTDQGLIFILAPKERKMRLEVGYGLEGDVPDARAKQLLDDVVRPYLKANRTYAGTRVLIDSVARIKGVTLENGDAAPATNPTGRQRRGASPLLIFGILIFIMLFRISPLGAIFGLMGGGRRGGGGFFGGGGGGGGGWGGGGGGFGGGGASSNW